VATMIHTKQIVWPVRADSGDERFLLREAMLSGKVLSPKQRQEFAALAGRIEGVWKLVQDEGRRTTTPQRLKDAIAAADKIYFVDFRGLRNGVMAEMLADRKPQVDMKEWLKLSGAGRTAIYEVAKTAFDLASEHAATQLADAN